MLVLDHARVAHAACWHVSTRPCMLLFVCFFKLLRHCQPFEMPSDAVCWRRPFSGFFLSRERRVCCVAFHAEKRAHPMCNFDMDTCVCEKHNKIDGLFQHYWWVGEGVRAVCAGLWAAPGRAGESDRTAAARGRARERTNHAALAAAGDLAVHPRVCATQPVWRVSTAQTLTFCRLKSLLRNSHIKTTFA